LEEIFPAADACSPPLRPCLTNHAESRESSSGSFKQADHAAAALFLTQLVAMQLIVAKWHSFRRLLEFCTFVAENGDNAKKIGYQCGSGQPQG
jgi:hypothetical protein